MDFIDSLRQFAAKVNGIVPKVQTEAATRSALILPFFSQVLGYDVSNLDEFVPEFTADVADKRTEKVDFAIFVDSKPAILIETKWCGEPLGKFDGQDLHQLYHYFVTTSAKFGILTNGLVYRFYSDLEETNKMDLTPFLEIDLRNLKDTLVPELKKFCKGVFDADSLYSSASDLKYTNAIRAYFKEQFDGTPNDEFIRFVTTKVYEGKVMVSVLERFKPLVKTTLDNYVTELLNERIQGALKQTKEPEKSIEPQTVEVAQTIEEKSGVVTTEEELQAFYIVKAVLAGEVDIARITYKDTMNYFAVLVDGMPTRWVCRFRLKENKKYISFPSPEESGKEIYTEFAILDDLYGQKDTIIASAKRHIK
jgi:hypothetical protein